MRQRGLIYGVSILAVCAFALTAVSQEAKTYTVNKVKSTPPKIDGNFTEDEWAGSSWTDEFYGLDLDPNAPEFKGARVDSVVNYKWRALWDEDYLYVLITCDLKYLNPNGKIWTADGETDLADPTQVLAADDVGYAGWGSGTNLDFEVFLVPSWTEATGNDATINPPNYQICYFPLKEMKDDTGQVVNPSNFGVRGAAGPPFFYTGVSGAGTMLPAGVQQGGGWNPISDSTVAQQKGVKIFQLAAQPHEIAGAKIGTAVVAQPVLEIAFPFAQFGAVAMLDSNTGESPLPEDFPIEGDYMNMKKDAQGHWAKTGDQWLINVCAYTDGVIFLNNTLAYITWNQMVAGGFHNWPKGIMTFAAPVSVGEWMVY